MSQNSLIDNLIVYRSIELRTIARAMAATEAALARVFTEGTLVKHNGSPEMFRVRRVMADRLRVTDGKQEFWVAIKDICEVDGTPVDLSRYGAILNSETKPR